MGKKSGDERRAAHAAFEQRHAAAKENGKKDQLPHVSSIRLAAEFLLSAEPERAADITTLPEKVLTNIAGGRFNPSVNQSKLIVSAAKQIGWAPPTNG